MEQFSGEDTPASVLPVLIKHSRLEGAANKRNSPDYGTYFFNHLKPIGTDI
jgi:hypothetical protein